MILNKNRCLYLIISFVFALIISVCFVMGAEVDAASPERPDHQRVDPEAPVIVTQPESVHFVYEGSTYEVPTYTVSAKLPDESTATEIIYQWYVEGTEFGEPITRAADEDQTVSITVDQFADRAYGVYPVYCTASTLDGHTVSSFTTNFVVIRGVTENSLLTFSDLHEKWDNVGTAIRETMDRTGGYIPSLVIATGDFNNSYYAGWNEDFINKTVNDMIHRIELQLAGIDTVWVSGNHDNGYATGFTNANKRADFGMVDDRYYNVAAGISGTGIIFDSRSEAFGEKSGTASLVDTDSGLIVIGINYEDIGSLGAYAGSTNGRPTDRTMLRYGNADTKNTVYEYLNNALSDAAANYNGELVVISTHAGLHAVGKDPDSTAGDGPGPRPGAEGGGGQSNRPGDDYSISESQEIVKLINRYVDEYDMDVVFLFGHNHTRGEKEFIKLPGGSILSMVDSVEKTTEENTLLFTYAHAGYITDRNDQRYTYLTWDKEGIHRYIYAIGSTAADENLSKDIERTYVWPEEKQSEDTTEESTEEATEAESESTTEVTTEVTTEAQTEAQTEATTEVATELSKETNTEAMKSQKYVSTPDTADDMSDAILVIAVMSVTSIISIIGLMRYYRKS